MWITVGGWDSSHVRQDAHPIRTNKNVPKVSLNNGTRNSILETSSKPRKSFAPFHVLLIFLSK
ncbi:GSCOCG00001300001-RA-CDS [Cotesia congregata]|nr:GSCOCG00001300001-RA-CDS [Cotesia congregata]